MHCLDASYGLGHKEADHGPRVPRHGRTLIRKLSGWDREVIERHLVHGSDEELSGAYDRATFLNQRRKMIQVWADLLDELAADNALAMPSCREAFGQLLNSHTSNYLGT